MISRHVYVYMCFTKRPMINPCYLNNHVSSQQGTLWPQTVPQDLFHCFSTFLIEFDFPCSLAWSFSLHLWVLYVDDIVLTRSNLGVNKCIACLGTKFTIEDLSDLHYFFSIELPSMSHGLFLRQSKYAYDILEWVSMVDHIPFSTPIVLLMLISHFFSLVRALLYLVITCPDLSHCINTMCQFMYTPTESL